MANWMSSKRFACLSLLVFLFLSPVFPAHGDETVIIGINVNQVDKGLFFIIMGDDGDFLITPEDLKGLGIRKPEGTVHEIEGEFYISLSSIKGVEFSLDEEALALNITAMPYHFEKQVIDFVFQEQLDVIIPKDSGGFLNYAISHATDFDSSRATEVTNQLGLRYADLLFLTDTVYTMDQETDRFVRLMSNITYDRRRELQRVVIGDFFTSSGEFGSSLNLGGISFSKTFTISPNFVKHNLIDLSGAVSLPTQMDVYMDGMRFRRETLPPGPFELQNITPRQGAGLLEVVLTDPFGNEQRLMHPFYISDDILTKGLHEYSYNIGYLREDFGIKSFDYGDLIISAFHRYGINNVLTAGFHGEAAKKRYNLGPSTSFFIKRLGVIDLAMAFSQNEEREKGTATSINYIYQGRKFNIQLNRRDFSNNYNPILSSSETGTIRSDTTAVVGFTTRRLGSVSLGYHLLDQQEEADRKTLTVTYSKTLLRSLRAFGSYTRIEDEDHSNEFMVGLSYNPIQGTILSTRHEKVEDTSTETVQAQKNVPQGEGWGGNASYQRINSDTISTDVLNTNLQYNARHATLRGRYQRVDEIQTFEGTVSGGIAYVGRTLGLSRPITDSFGLVQVGELENIRVYVNNQEIGKTNASGRLLIPNVSSYYNNQISIEDKDIPIDYLIDQKKLYISPSLKSGSQILFDVEKFQAVIGRIHIRVEDQVKPLEFYEIHMVVDEEELTFLAARDGEFYLENISPGSYRASLIYQEKACLFDIIVPVSEETMIDLGELVCELSQ
jgi:outer membrane usher protein